MPNVSKIARGDDGEYIYFTIKADVPANIEDVGGFFLTDFPEFWNYSNASGTLFIENIPEDMVITATTESGKTITFTPYQEGGTIENTYILVAPAIEDDKYQMHSFKVFFNTAKPNPESSKWILSEASSLSISYKIPFDAKTGTEWYGDLTGDLTVEDVLLWGYIP